MNQSFKVLFFLKKGHRYQGGPLPVYLRITVNGLQREMATQRHCEPAKWNQATGRARGNKAETLQLNAYLDSLQGRIFDLQKQHELRQQPLSAELVKEKLLGRSQEKQHTLLEVYAYHNQQVAQLVGKEYAAGTLKRFQSALTSLKAYLRWKFGREDLPIADLNHQFITDYEFYLKSVQGLQHNSAMGPVKKLKKIVRQCVANHWLEKDPFLSYKITTRETHRRYLSAEELAVLAGKAFALPRLDQVRDLFLFSCFTGLSYSDVVKLTGEDVVKGIDGEPWIHTTRTKTDTASRIPLLPTAMAIVEKYRQSPAVTRGRLLPTLSNQRMNSYLKEIADCCGLRKELTFHCARHTFATTVTLSNGVPIETVGKMLGHKNLRTTQHYAKILDLKVSEDMRLLREKFGADKRPDDGEGQAAAI